MKEIRVNRAQACLDAMSKSDWLPFLAYHHFAELVQHGNEPTAQRRAKLLSELIQVGCIRPIAIKEGLGNIFDLFAWEVETVSNEPDLDLFGVRNRVKERAIKVQSGSDALAPYLAEWADFREIVQQQARRDREIIAVDRSNFLGIGKTPVGVLLSGQTRTPHEAASKLDAHRIQLARDIEECGDQRIENPESVANDFYSRVAKNAAGMYAPQATHPALQQLVQAGIRPHEIKPELTLDELGALAVHRQQLSIVNRTLGKNWDHLCDTAQPDKLPSVVIRSAIRNHGQDARERKGSEMNDEHLAALAAYVDIVFVDKRTKEKLRRACAKDPKVRDIIKAVHKVKPYSDALVPFK
ncbi:MAG: hypothetical protein ACRBCJ_03480 [Hyphomicrobiaceae bacterium]